ncbi:MAG: respiratory chain complex I subunit 1 family protein [Hyphomicrobiales bacterium]
MAIDLPLHLLLLLAVPPLLQSVIARTKAWVAGRSGAPLLQPYRDLLRLWRKGAVYSTTTTWIFRAGPVGSLAALLVAGLIVPLASTRAPLGFEGDVIAFAYLLALARFLTVAAALDTGSSFEGMGASREAAFSALAEPALFLTLAILCLPARGASFQGAFGAQPWVASGLRLAPFLAAAVALFIVLLAENSRIPVDDPTTHLELTMIHEVMVLDHGGPDFAGILYGSALKLFLFTGLLVHALFRFPVGSPWPGAGILLAGAIAVAFLVGGIESWTARLRLPRVPQFLISAFAIAAVGLITLIYRIGR